MAYDLAKVNSYGTGALGVVSNPSGQINSYANVTSVSSNPSTITIGTPSTGIYETFAVGKEIMLHVSATNGISTDITHLAKHVVCKITAVNGSVLTIDKDPTTVIPATQLPNYIVQAITVAQFQKLTLGSGSISPPVFSTTNKYGGVLLLKCSDTLTMSGGSIDLFSKGIPEALTAYRPKTAQEISGTADTDKYSGWENHITVRQFLLNCGDGAVYIWAKHFAQTGTASRIGETFVAGKQFARGSIGGSTIALVAGDITGFTPSIISKGRGTGQGLGRCYIASNTKLRNDEGLYAYDCISNPSRITKILNIKNYGNGSLGDVSNPATPLNNYAKVIGISTDGKTITYANKTTAGIAPIAVGSTVMFHVSKHTDDAEMGNLAKFILAKVLLDDGSGMVLDTSINSIFDVNKIAKYNCQIISVAQFNNLTINTDFNVTPAWNDTTKVGGICAIAAKTKIDITGGKINVSAKGGGKPYGRLGLAFIGNAQMSDILPLGQGHGSVFLLTPNLICNAASRIGATYSGEQSEIDSLAGASRVAANTGFGGIGGNTTPSSGGYQGSNSTALGSGGGYNGGGTFQTYSDSQVRGGGGDMGGYNGAELGGYGCNGTDYVGTGLNDNSLQGAHIYAVIDTMASFNMATFSTGGNKNSGCADVNLFVGSGSSGYGSGGCGNNGTARVAGGASGWQFIYVNTIISENTSGVVI